MNRQDLLIATGILCVLLAVLHVGSTDHKSARDDERMYCEMVEIHRASNGAYGWPPYKGEEVCK
jgi:hypothetical protein